MDADEREIHQDDRRPAHLAGRLVDPVGWVYRDPADQGGQPELGAGRYEQRRAQGPVEVAGRTWQRYYDSAQKRTSLVDVPTGAAAETSVATVVTATAEDSELTTFTTALQPAHAS